MSWKYFPRNNFSSAEKKIKGCLLFTIGKAFLNCADYQTNQWVSFKKRLDTKIILNICPGKQWGEFKIEGKSHKVLNQIHLGKKIVP